MSDKPIKDIIIKHETAELKWGDVFSINPDTVEEPWNKQAARDYLFRAVRPEQRDNRKARRSAKHLTDR